MSSTRKITRRQAVHATGKVLAGIAGLDAWPSLSSAAGLPDADETKTPPANTNSTEKLRIATCQFPVSGTPAENAKYVRDFMHQAVAQGAHLLHTSEGSLSGYAGCDLPTFKNYDWGALRKETADLRALAAELKMWLVLGSAHFLDENTKPTNCQYLFDPEGKLVNRYDKCFLTRDDVRHYSAGNRLVTQEIRGVKVGLAICNDLCYPQLYIAYRKKGVTLIVHSFSNARSKGPNLLDTLDIRMVPTRCADNRLWAICNNSSAAYSHWGSFVARPDATIAKQLGINEPGILIHDFPDTLSPGGWYITDKPMEVAENEITYWGKPSNSPRQSDGQSEP